MEGLGIRHVGPKPISKCKESSTKGRHGEDLEYILEPGEVVEEFDDHTDETDSDLEDEPVPLSIDEVLVLSCI